MGLIYELEKKREEMVESGMSLGFTHPETVKLSQELDELLNKFGRVQE
jgi:hypothetical protein